MTGEEWHALTETIRRTIPVIERVILGGNIIARVINTNLKLGTLNLRETSGVLCISISIASVLVWVRVVWACCVVVDFKPQWAAAHIDDLAANSCRV